MTDKLSIAKRGVAWFSPWPQLFELAEALPADRRPLPADRWALGVGRWSAVLWFRHTHSRLAWTRLG